MCPVEIARSCGEFHCAKFNFGHGSSQPIATSEKIKNEGSSIISLPESLIKEHNTTQSFIYYPVSKYIPPNMKIGKTLPISDSNSDVLNDVNSKYNNDGIIQDDDNE